MSNGMAHISQAHPVTSIAQDLTLLLLFAINALALLIYGGLDQTNIHLTVSLYTCQT